MSLTLKEAKEITGGLSVPSKMPGYSYGIPAQACKTGSKLVGVKGSVCEHCYALDRGFYQMPVVKNAQQRRLNALSHPRWVEAMVFLIDHYTDKNDPYFRWHDSGDLQSIEHLRDICEVAKLTPHVKHWLPTREYKIVYDYIQKGGTLPTNVVIRLSATMVDSRLTTSILSLPTSMVSREKRDPTAYDCPARSQGNECKKCRACWDPSVSCVSYSSH